MNKKSQNKLVISKDEIMIQNNNNNSNTPKRQFAKQQLSQIMGLPQKQLNKLFFDERDQSSSTPKNGLKSTTNSSQTMNSFFSSNNNKSCKIAHATEQEEEQYRPSFSSSKSPIKRPQLSQSPLFTRPVLIEKQNQQTTPSAKQDFYFSIRKNSKTPPKKTQLTPLTINEDTHDVNQHTNNGDKNIQSYISQFESVLSPVSTTSISYSTINHNQDLPNPHLIPQNNNNNNNNNNNTQQSTPQNKKINNFQNSFNNAQSQSPYANSTNNLTKQLIQISNQTDMYFNSPKNNSNSNNNNSKSNHKSQKSATSYSQQYQQIWKSPQNSQRQPEIVTEKQVILQDMRNKIMSMKMNTKDTTFLGNQMKERYESSCQNAFNFFEEKNSFVLKYYIHLAHEEIDRLVQKKKNLLLSRNSTFSQFLTQFINGVNKTKITLKDEFNHLLPTAIDLKEIVSKDLALLFKNFEKENTQQSFATNQPLQKLNEETSPNYQSQVTSKLASTPAEVQQIPNQIKQLLVKANLQISNMQNELDIEKKKNQIHCDALSLEEGFEADLQNLKIQNSDLRKQIEELNSESGNIFRKYNENEKMNKQLKEQNQTLQSKIDEKGLRMETLCKDLEECKVSLQQMIAAQQIEKASFNITLQDNQAKSEILNERLALLEERVRSKDDQLEYKQKEIALQQQKLEELNNLKEINKILVDVDKKDHNLVTNLICLINKFENKELPRNTQITVIKYLEKLNLICSYSSVQPINKQGISQKKRDIKIKCINNSTLHLLNTYMQKLTDKIIKQQVLHEELIWFKDNIERLLQKFLQMSKNQISFNHIDFFKQEIQIKYDRIQQKIAQISPDISQLEAEMHEIASDQVHYIQNDFEDSTDDDLQESIDKNQLFKENSKLKMQMQHLHSQVQQLTLKDQLISSQLHNSLNQKCSNQSQQLQQKQQ